MKPNRKPKKKGIAYHDTQNPVHGYTNMNLIKYIRQKRENLSSNLCLPLVAGVTDNNATTKLLAAMPSRHPLAFFVPRFCLTSQVGNTKAQTHLNPFTGLNRHTYARSVTSYGGVTLQNIKAFRRICRAVTVCTESEPRHPLRNFRNTVVITQKQIGVANHG